jgi:malate permease and related proteins
VKHSRRLGKQLRYQGDKMKDSIINQVTILFLIMIVGIYVRKKEMLNAEVNKKLSDFLISITLPCLILSSFNMDYSQEMMEKARQIFMYSVIVHFVLIFVSSIFAYKFEEGSKKVLRFVTIFSNCGFMGYPVLEGLFGNTGVFYGAIFNIPVNLFMLSYGVMLYTGKRDMKTLKGALKHPGIIATVLGLILFSFSIRLPSPLFKTLISVGSMTTPLSMIIVGSMLAEIKVKEIFSGFIVYYASFIRLIIAPIITLIILKLLHADRLLLQIVVTIEAMPAAVISTVLAEKYGADSKLASKCVFISTIFSIITIPIIIMNI